MAGLGSRRGSGSGLPTGAGTFGACRRPQRFKIERVVAHTEERLTSTVEFFLNDQ